MNPNFKRPTVRITGTNTRTRPFKLPDASPTKLTTPLSRADHLFHCSQYYLSCIPLCPLVAIGSTVKGRINSPKNCSCFHFKFWVVVAFGFRFFLELGWFVGFFWLVLVWFLLFSLIQIYPWESTLAQKHYSQGRSNFRVSLDSFIHSFN